MAGGHYSDPVLAAMDEVLINHSLTHSCNKCPVVLLPVDNMIKCIKHKYKQDTPPACKNFRVDKEELRRQIYVVKGSKYCVDYSAGI